MRQPVYGLLVGNILVVVPAIILRAYTDPASLPQLGEADRRRLISFRP
ncbi:hypothetical protein OIV19_22440 [Brucella sp. HL-2]|nr:hypothetical protein [Brucella sp. HL-2]MCV9910352.1 hypothetical protein [Brucella sp. HL-2]